MNRLLVRIDEAQPGDADNHPAEQLTQNRRLPDPLRERAERFGRDEDGDEGEEEGGDR